MGLFDRSIQGNLKKTYKEKNKTRLAKSGEVMSPTAAADQLVSDGFDVCLQGQMVMRERGVGASVRAKANFGALIAPKLLKLEVGLSVTGEALGKRTIIVLRGRNSFAASTGRSVENSNPIMIGCLEGWKFVGGGGAELSLGVGGKLGSAAGIAAEKKDSNSGWGFKPDAEGTKTDQEVSSGKRGITTVGAEATFFAGLQAGASGTMQHYYAVDNNPFYTDRDKTPPKKGEKAPSVVRGAIEEVLKEGTVKSALKERACQFITANAGIFGGALSYHKSFGRNTSTETILAKLGAGSASLASTNPIKEKAENFMRQLRPYNGFPSSVHGLTFLHIKGKEGAYNFRIGASVEAAASSPIFAVSASATANLVALKGTGKTARLRFQTVVGNRADCEPHIFYQDFEISYKTFQRSVLEVGIDAKVSSDMLNWEKSLGDWVDEKLADKITSHSDLKTAVDALLKWHDFPGGRSGLSVAVERMQTSTMSYHGACIFWNKPTFNETAKTATADAQLGTGYVRGATFTAGNLANMADVLKALEDILEDYEVLYSPDDIDEADLDDEDYEPLLGIINQFKAAFHASAQLIDVPPPHLAAFLEHIGDLAHGIGAEIGEGAGVLVEAAFPVPESKRARLLNVQIDRDNDKAPPVVSLHLDCVTDVIKAARPPEGSNEVLVPESIRLRYRIGESYNASFSLPIGISIDDVVDVGVTLKNVWNMEVEGIPTLSAKFFNKAVDPKDNKLKSMDLLNPDQWGELVTPPPLLFRV